ncbi:MAG: ATP-dependent Clp protease ATP-binding subunit [Sarcina sp.]
MMFDKFTERSKKVLECAKIASNEFNHGYVGTEHILLGILMDDGEAKKVLKAMNVDLEGVRTLIKEYIGLGDVEMTYPLLEIPITPRTKRILEDSISEARSANVTYVLPEHILLSLIKDKDSVAFIILSNLEVNFGKIRKQLRDYLGYDSEIITDKDKIESKKKIREKKDINVLLKHGADLTTLAEEGKLDPVIGREDETQRVLEILCRRNKNNPCLIGEPGVGKTAIIEGLAQRIIEGNIPDVLKDKTIISLDLTSMVAGAKYRGEFEDRLKNAINELKRNKDVILFVDEIHTIVGAGGAEGAIDASNILKPALARGEIQCIGATTIDEYRKHIEKDTALERRFQPVMVGEPTEVDTLNILKGLKSNYENHHGVIITEGAISAAVELSVKYINDRFLPDKAIDLIDEGAARLKIEGFKLPDEIIELEKKIEKATVEKKDAIAMQDFEKAAGLRDNEKNLKEELNKMKNNWILEKNSKEQILDEDAVAAIVARWTKIPVEKLKEGESEKLLNIEKSLEKRVVGQSEAINSLAKAIRRARVGLKDPTKPMGSFLLLGPTGVGKTEVCKALASNLFGSESHMIRVDMSEYMEKHDVSKLIGAPPGYIGYDEGGQLTEKVRRNPYSVILLDEIEKAHKDVFNILLQILEDGRLTDAKGKVIDFKNTIIVMTSNIGADTLKKQSQVGFCYVEDKKKEKYKEMKNHMLSEVKKSFKPEFINRLDEVIVFNQLDENDLLKIVDILLEDTLKRIKKNDIVIEFTEEAKKFLVQRGNELQYGARPLKRVITKYIEDKLSEDILTGKINYGDRLRAENDEKNINFISTSKQNMEKML